MTPRRAQSPPILCFTERQFVDTIIESAFIKLVNVQNNGGGGGGGARNDRWNPISKFWPAFIALKAAK